MPNLKSAPGKCISPTSPNLSGPMVMKRYPNGAHSDFFFMKRTSPPCSGWSTSYPKTSGSRGNSVHPRPKAPVSTPVTWDEVADGFHMTDFYLRNVPERIRERDDLFLPLLQPEGRASLERFIK